MDTYRKLLRRLFLFQILSLTHVSVVLSMAQKDVVGGPMRFSIVTGASGYVGREVVHALWNDNQNCSCQKIYCLVRKTRFQEEVSYWRGKSEAIVVMPYDMLDEGVTIQDALEAASRHAVSRGSNIIEDNNESRQNVECCLYHVAAVFGPSEDHVQVARDNVKGTNDLLKILATNFPDWRLVLMSSMAAVRATGQEPVNGQYYTEKDWNTLSKLGENWGSSYQWSKAESEKQAWEIAKKHGISMTSVCPSFVFGPPSNDGKISGSYSITLVGQWVRGESQVQSRLFVDVRDVAKATVAAGTESQAIGQRYIVSSEERLSSKEVADTLKMVCKETDLGDPNLITYDTTFQGGAIPIGTREVSSIERLRGLGIELRPPKDTISEMGRSLLLATSKKQ